MAGEDVLSLKVLVDAARAVSELKRTQDAAKAAAEQFEKLSEAEQKAVSEMVRMVEANRAYEAAAKAVSVQDESASRLTQTYGRV